MRICCLLAVLFSLSAKQAEAVSAKLMANPIRKVVSMLQNMQGKIEAEGKTKEEMFNKFMCYCDGGAGGLQASISSAQDRIPQLESSIKGNKGAKAQLEADVAQAKSDRAEAASALAKAKAIREKEQASAASAAAETKSNLAAMSKAIPAIEQGSAAAFLQTNTGVTDKLRQLSVAMDMEAVDRDLLASFLADGSNSRGSGEILGILNTLKTEMQKDLAATEGDEASSAKAYESLVGAKKKERAALTKAIEEKTVRVGELAVSNAQQQNDLEDTSEALVEDQAMAGNLDKNCATKKQEWEVFKMAQATEMVALADTIKLLNDDDALDLFKKTLPSASSFMQVQVTTSSMQRRALALLKSSRKGHHHADPRLDFLETALHGGQMGFEKIVKMVDGLMNVLTKEQGDDDAKKAYCNAEFDKQADIAKALSLDISDVAKAIDDGEGSMKAIAAEIAALTAGIKDLDKAVADATNARKEENSNFVITLSSNSAAKQLLEMAKNRLNKLYNPDLYKEAPKRDLSEAEQITVNNGGTLAPTAAPGGIAGTEIEAASFVQVRSKSHRELAADMSFSQKREEGTGVVALINLLIADVDKNNQELEMEEKEGQSEYETFMADAKTKRSLDAKAITDKDGAKAETEAALEQNKLAKKDKNVELMETNKMISGLHGECDWILKFYETRKEARADELESLDKSKAVLNGADYSFLQTASSNLRR